MKRIFLMVLFFWSTLLAAQMKNTYNSQTLALFNKGDWETLIKVAEEALKNNEASYPIDFRLAVAYYNSGNYFNSSRQFEKIIDKYQIKNDLVLEYLYYAYLFSGRQEDALLTAKDFPFHLQEKINVSKFQFFDYLSVEGGVKISNEREQGIDNLQYISGGFGQQLGYKIKLSHAFTSLTQNYIDFDYNQREYYGNIQWHIAKGLSLLPAFHYINTKEKNQTTGRNENYMYTPYSGVELQTFLYYFALKKQWNRFSIMPSILYVNIEDNLQGGRAKMQYGLNLGYSVKVTRDKLWLGAGSELISGSSVNNFVWNVKLLYALNPKTYLYFRYLNANTSEFAIEDARYYYNATSVMVDSYNLTLSYYFTPKFSWYLNYQYENDYDTGYALSFAYNTVITGIKIDF